MPAGTHLLEVVALSYFFSPVHLIYSANMYFLISRDFFYCSLLIMGFAHASHDLKTINLFVA